jgi:hypothetical protein
LNRKPEKFASGAEARIDFKAVAARLKPCPKEKKCKFNKTKDNLKKPISCAAARKHRWGTKKKLLSNEIANG